MDDDTFIRDYLLYLSESLLPVYLVKRLEQDYARHLAGEPPSPLFFYVRDQIGRIERRIAKTEERHGISLTETPRPQPITSQDILSLQEFLDNLPGNADE